MRLFFSIVILTIILACGNPLSVDDSTRPEDVVSHGMWQRALNFRTVAHTDTATGLPIAYAYLQIKYQELGGGLFHRLGEVPILPDPAFQSVNIAVPNRPIKVWVAAIDERGYIGYWRAIRSIPPKREKIK